MGKECMGTKAGSGEEAEEVERLWAIQNDVSQEGETGWGQEKSP